MFDALEDWWLAYSAPWRRLHRGQFAFYLGLFSVPGMLFWLVGINDSIGGFLGPVTSTFQDGAINAGNPAALAGLMQGILAPTTSPATATGWQIDWTDVVNNTLFLALTPAVAARLLDMGHNGTRRWVLVGLIQAGLVVALFGDFNLSLPLASLLTVMNVIGYTWLCFAQSKPRKHSDIPPQRPQHESY
jgi:hypothetical protein